MSKKLAGRGEVERGEGRVQMEWNGSKNKMPEMAEVAGDGRRRRWLLLAITKCRLAIMTACYKLLLRAASGMES